MKRKTPCGMNDRLPISARKHDLVSTVVKDDPKLILFLYATDALDFTVDVLRAAEEGAAKVAEARARRIEKIRAKPKRRIISGTTISVGGARVSR